jgi:hypothetical protein
VEGQARLRVGFVVLERERRRPAGWVRRRARRRQTAEGTEGSRGGARRGRHKEIRLQVTR